MLEKPDLDDEKIIGCVQAEYGLSVKGLAFLPLGADVNTAVYRLEAGDGSDRFLKLRGGDFDEASVAVPKYLSDTGFRHAIPPIPTLTGELRAELPPFRVILYPYVEGQNAFQKKLSEGQWLEFGAALRRLHTAQFPPAVTGSTPREAFSPRWREEVRMFMGRIEAETFSEPSAAELSAYLRSKRLEILELVERAGQLAQRLSGEPLELILCHGDIHVWNLLLDQQDRLYIVDWDTLIFAPKERDLMFIGAGLGDTGRTPEEEEALFYRGYGRADISLAAIAYYRFERIIEDLAAYSEQIFLTEEGGEDRKRAIEHVRANFLPGSTIEMARRSDRALGEA